MSANLGRRLYAHIWETANPFLGIRINRISDTSTSKLYDFVSCRPQILTYPRNTTHIAKRFASGGCFVLGISPTSTAADTTASRIIPSHKLAAQYAWNRSIHTSNNSRHGKDVFKDTHGRNEHDHKGVGNIKDTSTIKDSSTVKENNQDPQPTASNRHLMGRLPHMPHLHRPSKEELLAAATGFWSRLKVRFKWFSIRSVRPFNLDEMTALFSWVLLGHVVWVVVGTTTFFSLLILAINTVFAQGMLFSLALFRIQP
jgi:distribution and morphology protein 31